MDFTLSMEQARDVNWLLDYYMGSRPISHEEAAAAWHRLAFAARGTLSTGWTTTQVERAFEPKREDPEATYDREIECCEACELANGECLTHREVGIYHDEVFQSLARVMRIFEKDPEQLGALLNDWDRINTGQEVSA